MNYTRPNDINHEDTPEDWLYSALVFSEALGLILREGEGIFLETKGDMLKLNPDAKRVIVCCRDNMISILDADERTDLKNGDWVQVIDGDLMSN